MIDKRTIINRVKAALAIALTIAAITTGFADGAQANPQDGILINESIQGGPRGVVPNSGNLALGDSLETRPSILKFGKPQQKKIQEGGREFFLAAMQQGQYTQVIVEQKGIDAAVVVYSASGKKIIVVNDSNGAQGTETIHLVRSVNGGSPKLEVIALKKHSKNGSFEIRIEQQRPATDLDRELMETQMLSSYSEMLYGLGRYDEALAPAEKVLILREKTLGMEHLDVALSLNTLALLCFNKGAYADAEPLFRRALAIREKVLGPDHSDVAAILNNLALLHFNKGAYADAESLFQRTLAIREKLPDADPSDAAQILNNLALVYQTQGEYLKAEAMFRRALEIRETAFGPKNPAVAQSLNNLASLYRTQDDFDKAEPLLRRALEIRKKAFGKDHPVVAVSLYSLAVLYLGKSDFDKAEPLFKKALKIREKALGPDHPYVASVLNGLALLYRAKGDFKEAVARQALCNEVRERDLVRNLASGSQRQKLLYLDLSAADLDRTLSLHIQSAPTDPVACRIAFEMLLRRKGRSLDAMTDSIAELRRRADVQDQKLLDELSQTRSKLSTAILQVPDKEGIEQRQANIKALENRVEELEAGISARSEEFRIQSQPITLDAVRKAIPPKAALVEFAAYSPYDPQTNRYRPMRYAAYVQSGDGDPLCADLGEAESIDKAAAELRKALRDRKTDVEQEVKPKARALDELVMKPIRKLIGSTRRLLISPDGELNLTPFDALTDEEGRYLVDNYEISYLTSGRDLLRLQTKLESKQPPLVIADPDFAEGPGPRIGENAFEPLKRLKASADEAAQITAKFANAGALMRGDATKEAIKNAHRPMLLHIATHGFFLKDEYVTAGDAATERLAIRRTALNVDGSLPSRVKLNNPLLRSGLFLAGANAKGEEAVLTAMEAAGLDLWGTKLVALSGCDTGVGDVKNGDGVYGLRRALVLAGSESQIISLWPVSDEGTRDLMAAYYEALKAGQGRSAGLRKVRLDLLAKPERRHPYYWASFIQSGEWANLDGKR